MQTGTETTLCWDAEVSTHFSCAMLIFCETLTFPISDCPNAKYRFDRSVWGPRLAAQSPFPPQPWPLLLGWAGEGAGGTRLLLASGCLCSAAIFQCANSYQLSPAPRGTTLSYRSFSPHLPLFFLFYGKAVVQNDPERWRLWSLAVPAFSGWWFHFLPVPLNRSYTHMLICFKKC